MASPIILISSDSSEESVDSYVLRVILFGTIPTTPELPLVSPFLCSDDSKANSEPEPTEQRPERHESLEPSFEFPLALVVAPPRIHSLSDSSSVYSSRCDASESSPFLFSNRSLDSSSPSAGPSRKRCRSHTTLVPSSTFVSRLIAPTLADLSSCKRFRDSYSSEASKEEHMEISTVDAETVADLGVSDRVRAPTEDGIRMGVEVSTNDIMEDEEDFEAEASPGGTMKIVVDPLATGGISKSTRGDAFDLEGTLYDIAHYISKVPVDRITEFETAKRQLEADRVDSLCRHMALSQEEFCHIPRDRDDTRRRLRRLESLVEWRLRFRR
uniref:Uncharacterized protein n=1 Tax=Tanacetum cinerariifolium TaxID=118510 RepID=A0A6L2KY84_TANCI|nr:hypothetical protein [Tanacetum cinerariifolium]